MPLQTSIRLAAAATLTCAVCCPTPSLLAQPPAAGGNPFAGQWSLKLSIATAPGGVTAGPASPFHCLYRVENDQFEVRPDGTFQWLAREAGMLHDHGTSVASSFQNDFELHLRAAGKAEAPTEPGAAGRPENRRLRIVLALIGGSGMGSSTAGGHYAYSVGVVSADLSQITFTSSAGMVTTVSGAPHEVTWEGLAAVRTSRQELAPDVFVERTIYEASRQSTILAVGQQIPVTERIEVEHVQPSQLVPRG